MASAAMAPPPRRPAVIALALVAALAAPAGPAAAQSAAPAQDRETAGWTWRCEAGSCRASLPSASGRQVLMIARLPAQEAYSVGLAAPTAIPDRERPMNLRIDGRSVATLPPERGYRPFERPEAMWLLDARAASALLASRGSARFEYLDVTGAPHDADFALAGLGPLLDELDTAAGRPARREAVPPQGLAAAPAATRADLVIRQGIPPRLIERHRAASDCEDPGSPLLKPIPPVVGSLSATAMLYAIPCVATGGQVSYRLWVLESGEIGGITALYFALYEDGFGWRGSDLLPNVAFDAAASRLTARSGARGESGCGSYGAWRWKGWAFAMEEFRAAPNCGTRRDPASWPRLFPPR